MTTKEIDRCLSEAREKLRDAFHSIRLNASEWTQTDLEFFEGLNQLVKNETAKLTLALDKIDHHKGDDGLKNRTLDWWTRDAY